MSLEEKIEKEFKSALKARDSVKVSTLRMLKAELTNLRLGKGMPELKDNDLIKVIQGQIKRHRDSIEQFEKGKRQDLVEKEKKELAILMTYMPEQLSGDELKRIVEENIKELGATTKKDMGKVIKAVMEKVKGKADGKAVSQIVSSLLS